MNNVEKALLEQMENDKFQKAVRDDFSCVDSLIEQSDIDRINAGKDNTNTKEAN